MAFILTELLIENFSQYPARRREISPAMQCRFMREPIYLRNIMMTFISNNALRRSKNYLNADMRKLGLKPFSTYYDFSAKMVKKRLI